MVWIVHLATSGGLFCKFQDYSVVQVYCVYTAEYCVIRNMAVSLPDFAHFDCTDLSSAGPRWKKWLSRFEVLMAAMQVPDTDEGKVRKV